MPLAKFLGAVACACCLQAQVAAQAVFYIDGISVDPPAPTTADPITITLHGSLTMTNAVITATSHSLLGNNIYLDVTTDTAGSGVPAMVPYDQSFTIGALPGGSYSIIISGDSVFDSAPGLQHLFTVSGGGGWICDSLNITVMQYSPVNDELIWVLLENTSMGQINDQCVYLYDQNDDLLAWQTVFAFPIVPGTTGFYMDVWPGATMPQGVFTGTLEVWSNNCTVFECALPWTADLCPTEPCTSTTLRIEPISTAPFPFDVPWQLVDAGLNTLASGTLEITGVPGTTTDTFCLAPGAYTFITDPSAMPDSTFMAWAVIEDHGGIASAWNVTDGIPDPLSFTLFAACIDSSTAIAEPSPSEVPRATCIGGVLHVSSLLGKDLGELWLFSTDGRAVKHERAAGNQVGIHIEDLVDGVYLLRATSTGRAMRVFVH